MINNEAKSFDIVDSKGIQTINIKQLTLREREKLFLSFEEVIKSNRRKEFLEMSKLMDIKERNKFLVECSNSNKVTTEEVIEQSQTVYGITEIFKVTSDKQLNWVEILSDETMILPVLKAFYWALGVDATDIDITGDKPIESKSEGVDKQGDFFQVGQVKS